MRMFMKNFLLVIFLLLSGPGISHAAVLIPSAEVAAAKSWWTCSMHPQVRLDHPGECPICHMKLTLLKASSDADHAVVVSPAAIQNMNLQTAPVAEGPVRHEIRTVGNITYDEPALAEVTTKVNGWIEKLYVDYTGQQVHRGDPLFELYSPELYNAQIEYLLTLKAGEKSPLADNALRKLLFLDISREQIAELASRRQPQKTLKITAPIDGVVLEKNVVAGQMVKPGIPLYRIADLSTVWVLVQIYEHDLPWIQLGQEAEMVLPYSPERRYHGRVTYIYPTVDNATRTVKVRLEFHNPGYGLKPGMYASVTLKSQRTAKGVLIPDTAVVRSGENNTVFVAEANGRFVPRSVTLGPRCENDRYQVLSGVRPGEKVVVSGQFLLDSESQLHAAVQRLSPNDRNEKSAPPPAADAEKLEYVCPMPDHAAITYQQPGKCPLCGMALIPVTPEQAAAAGRNVLYYTCPMPEHADVHEAKPGKCPRCGMTLIPVYQTKESNVNPAAPEYVCPMDPEVHSNRPGRCPKCGMNLILKKK